jgi:hypothetical protein
VKVGHCLATPRVSSVDGAERDATGRDHCCLPYQPGERTSPKPGGPPQMQYRGDGRIGVVVAKLLCRRPNVNLDLFGETRRSLALTNAHRAAGTGEGLRPSPAPLPGPSAPDISINLFPIQDTSSAIRPQRMPRRLLPEIIPGEEPEYNRHRLLQIRKVASLWSKAIKVHRQSDLGGIEGEIRCRRAP